MPKSGIDPLQLGGILCVFMQLETKKWEESMVFIGVNLGITSAKLLLVNEVGNVCGKVVKEYAQQSSLNNAEHHQVQAVYAGIRDLLHVTDGDQVAGIGIAGSALNLEKFCDGKSLLPKDHLNDLLTGRMCTDYTYASVTSLMDARSKEWSEHALELYGFNAEKMPEIYPCYAPVGTIRPEIAQELGLPEDTIVAAGTSTIEASAVGCGVLSEGMCNIFLNIMGAMYVPVNQYPAYPDKALRVTISATEQWGLLNRYLSTARWDTWWLDDILHSDNGPKEQRQITDAMLGNNPVSFLPGWHDVSVQPFQLTDKAVFVGITSKTTRAEMTQAVLEGVAFQLRDQLELIKTLGISTPTRARISGSGANSMLWRKIFANVLGMTIELPEVIEGPAFGAALLSSVASGVYPDLASAIQSFVHVTDIIRPMPELMEAYDEEYRKYCKLRDQYCK